MDTHNPQQLHEEKDGSPIWQSFMGKEECTIILAILYLIYFRKHFIENIFF